MTGTWIAVAAAALLAAIVLVLVAAYRARPRGTARAVILSLEDATSEDRDTGAVRSVQAADLLIDEDALEEIWTPAHLERLARTYWRFLTHVTLGLIRVQYTDTTRSVVLLTQPFRLLTFQAPEYEIDQLRGLARWRIERGVLVARRGRDGRGYLQIEVRRGMDEPGAATAAEGGAPLEPPRESQPAAGSQPARVRLHVEVEVANFYPAIALGISRRIYHATQSRIHVIVTYGFLRSLTRLDLAESRVGRLRPQ